MSDLIEKIKIEVNNDVARIMQDLENDLSSNLKSKPSWAIDLIKTVESINKSITEIQKKLIDTEGKLSSFSSELEIQKKEFQKQTKILEWISRPWFKKIGRRKNEL